MRFIVIVICSVGLFFPMYWLFEAVVGPNWGAGIAAVAMYIAFPVAAMKMWPEKPIPQTFSMETALTRGTLTSADFDIRQVVPIEEFEDEPHFLLDIGDNRTLYLSGKYLYGAVDSGRFPSTRIRVFWDSVDGVTYGVQDLGDRLIQSEEVVRPSIVSLESDAYPSDRDIIGQGIRDVIQALSRNA